MAQINSGWTYESSGIKSEVTAENLNAHVNNAELAVGAIKDQDSSLLSTDADELLIAQGTVLVRVTKENFTKTINATTITATTVTATQINGGSMVPIGAIILWSGTVIALPVNWKICDGTNGTPDLRGKFIRGSDERVLIDGVANIPKLTGTTGGADKITITGLQVPKHTHQISIRQMPQVNYYGSSETRLIDVAPVNPDFSDAYTGGIRHVGPPLAYPTTTPSGAPIPETATPLEILPSYYSLAYIMRVS